MEEGDRNVRNRTYALFAELGRPPTPEEVAVAGSWTIPDVREAWRRLHAEHALVLDPARDEIRMANPFSAVPTAHRVAAAGRWWYANCAWDAFGICAALYVDGRIETSCPDCAEPMSIDVVDERPSDDGPIFHVLVPARRWWDDIVFT